jgi:hypothetical protein
MNERVSDKRNRKKDEQGVPPPKQTLAKNMQGKFFVDGGRRIVKT